MQSVLISIKPKWCELIASGKKTIEVRKTKPKIETPFKCYIYCTNPRHFVDSKHEFSYPSSPLLLTKTKTLTRKYEDGATLINGKVVAEFICDSIIQIDCDSVAPFDYETKEYVQDALCMGRKEIIDYAGFTRPYGWHISDLVIYDEPKKLSEFSSEASKLTFSDDGNKLVLSGMTRPPQSWCYVEEAR